MLEDLIRKSLMLASKNRNVLAKNILSLALGELQTAEARGKVLSEKDKEEVVSKLVKSNNLTASQLEDGDQRKVDLLSENIILAEFLPKTLSENDTLDLINSVELNNCKTSGQAIGAVMKKTKLNNLPVDNALVKRLVESIFTPISK